MHKLILSVFLLWQLAVRAQPPHGPGPVRYLTVMSNHRTAALTIVNDTLIIVGASDQPEGPGTTRYPVNRIQYSLSPDKRQFSLINGVYSYPTHWYSESAFKAYSVYPGINSADSATMYRLANDYAQAMLAAADKARNTRLGDLYVAGTSQDILNGILIAHRFNPSTTPAEFLQRVQQCHIQMQNLPILHPISPRPTFDSTQHH